VDIYGVPTAKKVKLNGSSFAIDGTYKIEMGPVGVNVFRDGYEVSAEPSISVPGVQDGTYDVLVGVAGAEVWRGIAKVGPGGPRISAVLKPGSDIRFEIVTPDGSPGFSVDLFKDGKKFEAESQAIRAKLIADLQIA
jgi:hypothetical protein